MHSQWIERVRLTRLPGRLGPRGAFGGAGRWLARGVVALAVQAALVSLCAGQQSGAPVRDPSQIIQRYSTSWKEIRRRYIVMQGQDYSCGAAALATVLRFYWGDDVLEPKVLKTIMDMLTPDELKDRLKNGLSMADLKRTAIKMGYEAEVGTVQLSDLSTSKIPLIVAITTSDGYDHFVVVRGIVQGYVYLADPTRGNIRLTVPMFRSEWQKNAVLVVLKPKMTPQPYSALTVRRNEAELGEMNNQVIRMAPLHQTGLPFP